MLENVEGFANEIRDKFIEKVTGDKVHSDANFKGIDWMYDLLVDANRYHSLVVLIFSFVLMIVGGMNIWILNQKFNYFY